MDTGDNIVAQVLLLDEFDDGAGALAQGVIAEQIEFQTETAQNARGAVAGCCGWHVMIR
jgi:hypothetical protein